jgi:hypothetical protein
LQQFAKTYIQIYLQLNPGFGWLRLHLNYQLMRLLLFHGFLLVAFITVAGCTNDSLPEPTEIPCDDINPTYEADIRPIVETSCAYSGCHLGTAPGLYDSYEGLLSQIDAGSFRERTITMKADPNLGMPPNYAPADRPEDLTEDELRMIECWLDAGHPQN